MNVKTITAPTIHAALIEARRILGDDVVLMESVPAEGDEPARITVMADTPERTSRPERTAQSQRSSQSERTAHSQRSSQSERTEHSQRTAHSQRTEHSQRTAHPAEQHAHPALAEQPGGAGRFAQQNTAKRPAYGYAGSADVALATEDRAGSGEGLSGRNGLDYSFDVGGRTLRDLPGDEHLEPRVEPNRRGITGPPGRGRLFPNRSDLVNGTSSQVPALQGNPLEAIENLIAAQLQLLHDRLDKIERRFDGAIIGAGQAWTANPLFATMLNQGMRPATVTKIFDTLAQKGYQPDTNVETLKWAVAQEIRRSLDCAAPKQTSGAQVFIGPSGAGKTSLLLKLASHPGFFGRRDTAVIVIEPEEETSSFHHSPLDLFRMHGLPVQSVGSVDDMQKAILRVQHFDHILIDTPPMPLHEAPARKVLRHVKKLVDPIMPLRVQFVLNATRSLEDFSGDFVRSLALRPEMVALTHLDETKGWGRIAEWLMAVEMPVQFISTGPAVPDGVISFSPTWFVEEMMKL